MIIFDLDGTLWDTREITLKSASIVADKYPDIKEITMKEVEGGMGYSFEETAEIYMPYLDKETREKYLAIIDEEVRQNIIRNGATIYDGVIKVITNLGRKYKLGIVTNNTCLTLCNPMDCSLPGSSVHGIFQARILEWGAIAFSAHGS